MLPIIPYPCHCHCHHSCCCRSFFFCWLLILLILPSTSDPLAAGCLFAFPSALLLLLPITITIVFIAASTCAACWFSLPPTFLPNCCWLLFVASTCWQMVGTSGHRLLGSVVLAFDSTFLATHTFASLLLSNIFPGHKWLSNTDQFWFLFWNLLRVIHHSKLNFLCETSSKF